MINYYCPGFVEGQPVYKTLLNLKENHPECFYDDVNIKVIYGSFPSMIWNGGSHWFGPHLKKYQIETYFDWYANKNIILQLTCTNPILEEIDLYDRYCNMILESVNTYHDTIEILVSSQILEDYIKNLYPDIKINKSIIGTTKIINGKNDNLKYYLQEAEKYNRYVLPRKYCVDLEMLNLIPKKDRNKFEILVNDPCPIDCPYLYSHYENFGHMQNFTEDIPMGCIMKDEPFRNIKYKQYQYSHNEILNKLVPLNFTEIKLSGRTDRISVILSIVPYLIKPEYQSDLYEILLSDYINRQIPPFIF